MLRSEDGERVVFSSDMSGIFNLYAIDVTTGETRRLANVVGAALSPTVSASGDSGPRAPLPTNFNTMVLKYGSGPSAI